VATSAADATKSGSAALTITASPITSFVVGPATLTIGVGASYQLYASVTPVSESFSSASWQVTGAGCGSIDPSGYYTAPATVPAGTCLVTGTSRLNPSLSSSATVTVTAPAITSVGITPANATLQLGASQAFGATVSPSSANQAVTWSVSGGAGCGTVSAGGLYVAPTTMPSGSCGVIATSVAGPTQSSSAVVTLAAASIASVAVEPSSATVLAGATQQFMAVVGGAGASQQVTWSVVEGASCGTVDAGGLFTAVASSGTCQVTATSVLAPAKSGSALASVCAGGASCVAPHVVAVWGGARHCVARKSDGSVWGWGFNWYGNLGDGTTVDRHTPVQMRGPGGSGFVTTAAIMGGESHNFVLLDDGTVFAAGWNVFGQLGDGTNTNSSVLVPVSGLTSVTGLGGRGYHSLAIRSDGSVWTWGDDRDGQLGNGASGTTSNVPVRAIASGSGVTQVTGGGFQSAVLTSSGAVMAWGDNANGQVGNGNAPNAQLTPVTLAGLANIVQISGGWAHTVALASDGTVWTWGGNGNGQLGVGNRTDSDVPVHVAGLTGVIAVSGGDCHTAALRADGTVWTWGCNGVGELGNGNFVDSLLPIQVIGIGDVVQIAARDYHNVVVRADGTVWTWGFNANGQLGNGGTVDSNTPVQVVAF
jgi:alpha-tubulin suppressor-like RCC1 family protein